MSRWTIYTAIVGDIDTLVQPRVVDSRFDYVCFVRRGSGRQGVWELREIGEDIGDDRRPYATDTWEKAFELWDVLQEPLPEFYEA